MRRIASVMAVAAIPCLMLFASFAVADDYMENTAGGGGWFYQPVHGVPYKDTFGIYLDANDYSMSSFVLHAREVPTKIHAYEFSEIMIEDDDMDGYWTAHAWGKALGSGMDWDFHLKVTDKGKPGSDNFWLEVTLVDDPDTKLTWNRLGFAGGNVWVNPMT